MENKTHRHQWRISWTNRRAKAGGWRWGYAPHVCLSLLQYAAYLQGEDFVVVQRGHLFPRQGVSRLVIDLKAGVELQHVQQLQRWDGTSYLDARGGFGSQSAGRRSLQVLLVCGTWQKRCPSFSRWERLDRWQLTTKWESSNTVLNQRLVGSKACTHDNRFQHAYSRVLTHFDQWFSRTLKQMSMTKLKSRNKH